MMIKTQKIQLQDVVQSRIFLKHIVLAITHAILAHFSSKWAQNVRIFREDHVGNRLPQRPVTLTGFFIFEEQATATDGLVAIGCV